MFPAPGNWICYLVPLQFGHLFHCFPDGKVVDPLFPQTLGVSKNTMLIMCCWSMYLLLVKRPCTIPGYGSPASSICLPFIKAGKIEMVQGMAMRYYKQQLLFLRYCKQNARHTDARIGVLEDRKACAWLILFYLIMLDLVAVPLPHYLPSHFQDIYISSIYMWQ